MKEREEVMVNLGSFEPRIVHQSKKHPQTGWIRYHGKKRRVYIGFWCDEPVWKLIFGPCGKQEYNYCRKKALPIEQDPDYCGNEEDAWGSIDC
jgi:hypothetical protein